MKNVIQMLLNIYNYITSNDQNNFTGQKTADQSIPVVLPSDQGLTGNIEGITNPVSVKSPTITWTPWKYTIAADDISESLPNIPCHLFTIGAASGNTGSTWVGGGALDGVNGDELQAGSSPPTPFTGTSNLNQFQVYGKAGFTVSGNYGVISP